MGRVLVKKYHPKRPQEYKFRGNSLAHIILLAYIHHQKKLLTKTHLIQCLMVRLECSTSLQMCLQLEGAYTLQHTRGNLIFRAFIFEVPVGFLCLTTGQGHIFQSGFKLVTFCSRVWNMFHFPFVKSPFNPNSYF